MVVVDLIWMAREANPGWRRKVCSWICGVWGWAASLAEPTNLFPKDQVYGVCLSVIGGVCDG